MAENFRAVFYAPFYAAQALGFYAREGVEIELVTSSAPGGGPAALADGSADKTPTIARHPEMTKAAIFGARSICVVLGCVVARMVKSTGNCVLNGRPALAASGIWLRAASTSQ